jgi:hypothetical protein
MDTHCRFSKQVSFVNLEANLPKIPQERDELALELNVDDRLLSKMYY